MRGPFAQMRPLPTGGYLPQVWRGLSVNIRIFHLITDLDRGGAETALCRLLGGLVREGFDCRVASLIPAGPVAEDIRNLGVPVEELGMRRGRPSLAAVTGLAGMLRAFRPHVLQTWLYHADLLGLVAARLARVPVVAWNLRCALMELEHYSRVTTITRKACATLSRRPAVVVANSHAAVDYHKSLGYRPRRWEVIPNGFDLDAFRPDPEARTALRHQLHIPEDAPLVGLAARYDHMKGHEVFCRAASRILDHTPEAHFALCGDGITPDNSELVELLHDSGLGKSVHLLGRLDHMPWFFSALDVACSSSHGESFSNVLGEALACGTPCVATDVGDSARIVGDAGAIVPTRDPEALASALNTLLDMDPTARRELGDVGRKHVEEHYSLSAIVAQYATMYRELARKMI